MKIEDTVDISNQHDTLYDGGRRDVHFNANISPGDAQGIIDDIQRNILSIHQRDSCVFVKQSNDTFVYGIVESISQDGTCVRIKIRADGSYKMIQLKTNKFQQYIRQPYLPTKMRRLESISQIHKSSP